MPEVSVIIPIYNTAAYLRKALDSICDQTLKELEIILIDDGSTDGSRGIIEEYAERDARIRWHAQPNQGQGVARNTALALATGRYIYFMDSDDLLGRDACGTARRVRAAQAGLRFLRCRNHPGRPPHAEPLRLPQKRHRG